MREYLILLIATALVCGIVQMIAPESSDAGLHKHIGLVCGLCVLCVSIAPFSSFIEKISSKDGGYFGELVGEGNLPDYEQMYEDNLIFQSEANMSAGLKTLLVRDLGLDGDSFEVTVTLVAGEREYLADKVVVYLYGKAVLYDPHAITDYVNGLLGCECDIIYQ